MKHFSNSYPLKCPHHIFCLFFNVHCTIYLSTFNIHFHTFINTACFFNPLIISGLGFEDESVVGGFYSKDIQGLQNLRQVDLLMNDFCNNCISNWDKATSSRQQVPE